MAGGGEGLMATEDDWRKGTSDLLDAIKAFRTLHKLDMISVSLCSDGSGHLEFLFCNPSEDDGISTVEYSIYFDCLNALKLILLHGDPKELAREL